MTDPGSERREVRVPGMLVLTIPLAAGFDAVATALDDAVRRHTGSTWFYGNVYDPSDGVTPLNWW